MMSEAQRFFVVTSKSWLLAKPNSRPESLHSSVNTAVKLSDFEIVHLQAEHTGAIEACPLTISFRQTSVKKLTCMFRARIVQSYIKVRGAFLTE